MSTVGSAALVTVQRPPPQRRARATVGLLRGTGVAGMASAAVIAVATVLAVDRPAVAPLQPDAAEPRPVLRRARSAGTCSASTTRAGMCCPG